MDETNTQLNDKIRALIGELHLQILLLRTENDKLKEIVEGNKKAPPLLASKKARHR